MNIREITNLKQNYARINREERNYAAIFYAALCKPGNPERLIKKLELECNIDNDFGIYFEYAYLRDLWFNIKGDNNQSNQIKKAIIREKLDISGIDEILELPIPKINETFGVAGEPSGEYIQLPGKWSLRKFNKNFEKSADILNICKFKWSFNIKPDIVIHLSKDHAICIEAKYESGEGSYPSSDIEKSIFNSRGIDYVGQLDLQKYMMENLLGIKTDFLYLVHKTNASKLTKTITWKEAFDSMDISGMPIFARDMIRKIST